MLYCIIVSVMKTVGIRRLIRHFCTFFEIGHFRPFPVFLGKMGNGSSAYAWSDSGESCTCPPLYSSSESASKRATFRVRFPGFLTSFRTILELKLGAQVDAILEQLHNFFLYTVCVREVERFLALYQIHDAIHEGGWYRSGDMGNFPFRLPFFPFGVIHKLFNPCLK
jgi:hypothetical protein